MICSPETMRLQARVAALEEQITSQSHYSTHERQLMTGLRGRVAVTSETMRGNERTGYVCPISSKLNKV
jgi:hypothetical protein